MVVHTTEDQIIATRFADAPSNCLQCGGVEGAEVIMVERVAVHVGFFLSFQGGAEDTLPKVPVWAAFYFAIMGL